MEPKANLRLLNEIKEFEKESTVNQPDETPDSTQSYKRIKLGVFAFIQEQKSTLSDNNSEITKIDREYDSYLKESVITDKTDVLNGGTITKFDFQIFINLQ